jgi:hypothetical protein
MENIILVIRVDDLGEITVSGKINIIDNINEKSGIEINIEVEFCQSNLDKMEGFVIWKVHSIPHNIKVAK